MSTVNIYLLFIFIHKCTRSSLGISSGNFSDVFVKLELEVWDDDAPDESKENALLTNDFGLSFGGFASAIR